MIVDGKKIYCPYCQGFNIDDDGNGETLYCFDCAQEFGWNEAVLIEPEDRRLRRLAMPQLPGMEVEGD